MKYPIPLILAMVLAVGAVMTVVVQVKYFILGSWDVRYAAFNGTHIYQTGPMINVPYRTLYLGYGTAYFRNPVSVFYLETVRANSAGDAADLGRYLPIRVVVTSGSLPTNTFITWTDPYGGATRRLYFVAGANRAYVVGTYRLPDGTPFIAVIPMRYVVQDNHVYFYPVERGAFDITEACNIALASGFDIPRRHVVPVISNRIFDCVSRTWTWERVRWVLVASSVTTASLYPSPAYYEVPVTVGSNSLIIYLSYWYAVNADPGFFAVKPG
jgi:hypothetical protein